MKRLASREYPPPPPPPPRAPPRPLASKSSYPPRPPPHIPIRQQQYPQQHFSAADRSAGSAGQQMDLPMQHRSHANQVPVRETRVRDSSTEKASSAYENCSEIIAGVSAGGSNGYTTKNNLNPNATSASTSISAVQSNSVLNSTRTACVSRRERSVIVVDSEDEGESEGEDEQGAGATVRAGDKDRATAHARAGNGIDYRHGQGQGHGLGNRDGDRHNSAYMDISAEERDAHAERGEEKRGKSGEDKGGEKGCVRGKGRGRGRGRGRDKGSSSGEGERIERKGTGGTETRQRRAGMKVLDDEQADGDSDDPFDSAKKEKKKEKRRAGSTAVSIATASAPLTVKYAQYADFIQPAKTAKTAKINTSKKKTQPALTEQSSARAAAAAPHRSVRAAQVSPFAEWVHTLPTAQVPVSLPPSAAPSAAPTSAAITAVCAVKQKQSTNATTERQAEHAIQRHSLPSAPMRGGSYKNNINNSSSSSKHRTSPTLANSGDSDKAAAVCVSRGNSGRILNHEAQDARMKDSSAVLVAAQRSSVSSVVGSGVEAPRASTRMLASSSTFSTKRHYVPPATVQRAPAANL